MQDSIIVYRNPLEKAMWESLSGDGGVVFVVFMVSFVVSITVLMALKNLYYKVNKKRQPFNSNINTVIIGASIVLAAIAVILL